MDHHKFIALKLGTFKGQGPLGGEGTDLSNTLGAVGLFSKIISNIVGIMTIVGFIWFIISLFLGVIGWLASGGDKTKLQEAQKQITTSLTGLIIVISAIFLIKVIEILLSVNILNFSEVISNIWN